MPRRCIPTSDVKPTCDLCDKLADIQYTDPYSGCEYAYCDQHWRDPDVARQKVKWVVRRRRYLPVGNSLSEKITLPKDSREHEDLRWDMCEVKLIGSDGTVRYYFIIITGHDQFAAWEDQFIQEVMDFVCARTQQGRAPVHRR